jgi:hypothetical protein
MVETKMKILKSTRQIKINKWKWNKRLPKNVEPGFLKKCCLIPITVEKTHVETMGYCIARETKAKKWEPIHKYLMDYKKAQEWLNIACNLYKDNEKVDPQFGYELLEDISKYRDDEKDSYTMYDFNLALASGDIEEIKKDG